MSHSYLVGQITVIDAERWAEYRSKVPATLEAWGAELVMRGKKAAVLAGEHRHTDIVLIRFPDQAAIAGWHASAAYQALIPLRQKAADVVLVAYDE